MSHKINTVDKDFLQTYIPKYLVIINVIFLCIYFFVITFWFDVSSVLLFTILMVGQTFYFLQGLAHMYTIWDMSYMPALSKKRVHNYAVDVFVTVAGEPISVIQKTVEAAQNMRYSNFSIFILNDGFVAKKDNWQDVEVLAKKLGVQCITRKIAGGAKAGNINNALTETSAPFIVIFDADHVPEKDFLQNMMGYFADESVGFVQAPQYYKNSSENMVTGAAWEQQQLFFGAICKGKNRLHATTMCGTNMIIKREALVAVGGVCDSNIAEDFITGMFIHEKGWKSVYVPEILAQGLAPEDFLSYYKQQLRWARGSLEVLIRFNPLLRRGLTWGQRIQYMSAASYYMSGVIVMIHAIIPLVYFFTGHVPFTSSTMALVAAFLPYMLMTIYNLQYSTNFTYTFRAISFSMASFWIHMTALFNTLVNKKQGFSITSKVKIAGNFPYLVIPHLVYFLLVVCGVCVALWREGLTPSFVTNISWVTLYVVVFIPFIRAAIPEPKKLFISMMQHVSHMKAVYKQIFIKIQNYNVLDK